MTAISFVVRRDALHLIADAAFYSRDGVLRAIGSKIQTSRRPNFVMAMRGTSFVGAAVRKYLDGRFETFDELADGIELAFREYCQDHRPGDTSLQLMLGGHSRRRDAFEAIYISSHPSLASRNGAFHQNTLGSNIEPDGFHAVRLGVGVWTAPGIAPDGYQRAFGRPICSVDDITGIQNFARGLLELQRELRWGRDSGLDGDFCIVGGFGELATLTRDKIETGLVVTWPDAINRLIEPAAVDWGMFRRSYPLPRPPRPPRPAFSDFVPAPNRKQRRASARRA